MTKHNGKARKGSVRVGHLLSNRKQQRDASGNLDMTYRHTTNFTETGPGLHSVLDRNDLEELMAVADLADKDFAAERTHVIVVSTGIVDAKTAQENAAIRKEAEDRNRHLLKVPRRPAWDATTTPEQLDQQERSSFLVWRRSLADLEDGESLCLTPFEKNLDVWRQLWRVLERSDIMVQVVDARDPLLYRCEDLEDYARELHASKASLILLNKADLVPQHVRQLWADYFKKAGVKHAFWSAFAANEALKEAKQREAAGLETGQAGPLSDSDDDEEEEHEDTRILDVDGLLELLEREAAAAVKAAGSEHKLRRHTTQDVEAGGGGGPPPQHPGYDGRLVVGLVGYPNVGKSTTINALFGSKKTAVAPTPGKTKHFQTLNVTPSLCLCDCPGLVFPKFANSKAEMVAAGVVPIDRLTDVRAPLEVVAARIDRAQIEKAYNIALPTPRKGAAHSYTAAELLRGFASARGWVASSGLPDETRAGRQLLKDYTAGKLKYCALPPGADPALLQNTGQQAVVHEEDEGEEDEGHDDESAEEGEVATKDGGESALTGLDEADLELLQGLTGAAPVTKPQRPSYKFNKKPVRGKKRGDGTEGDAGGVYDGAALKTGKKGGLVRVAGYVTSYDD